MFVSLKSLRTLLALVAWFNIVLLVSYLSLGRAARNSDASTASPSFHHLPAPNNLTATKSEYHLTADSDNDGLPDSVEMRTFNDRENFRHWFTWIAEMQFYQLSDQWNSDQRDCAGLVRFAWREALRRHDRQWFQRMGNEYKSVAPDVSFTIDQGPLREKLFRTAYGTYKDTDLANGKFSEFADAQTIKTFNCNFVGRNRSLAKPGDLIFFHQPWVQKFPYHVMIFLGAPRLSREGGHDWVVYHTGASATDAGEVKKVRLAVLDEHPDKRWRPVQSNPNFLGFYRLKILD